MATLAGFRTPRSRHVQAGHEVNPVFNGNPHAPSTAWLNAIAGPGGYTDADDGDEGTDRFDRDGDTYVVTVAKNPDTESDDDD